MARRPRRPSAETRAEILAKAQDLFRIVGYAKTSIADIAAALDMSPANIFKHFPSKAALAEATSEIHLALILDALAAISPDLAPPDRFRRFAEVLLTCHLENSEANPHLFDIVLHAMSTQPASVRAFDVALQQGLLDILADGQQSGAFVLTGDPAAIVDVLLDCIAGVTHPLLIRHVDRAQLFTRLERMIDFLNASLSPALEK